MSFLPVVVHLAGFSSFAYAIYYDVYELQLPEHIHSVREKFGGHAKYLTFLNMCLQCLYFGVCLLADLAGRRSSINRLKDIMFASAAFPIGIFVAVIFWGLYAVDRELIFPAKLDGHFPAWLNHFMHTTVLPLQLAEIYLSRHEYPSRGLGGLINTGLTLAYLFWLNYIFQVAGFWVYPVFKVLSDQTRPVFMAACCAMGGFFYIIGEKLDSSIWKKQKQTKQEEPTKKRPKAKKID